MRRLAAVLATAASIAGASLGLAQTAGADVWTPIASGTSSGIQAIDYQASDRFWFATTAGGLAYRKPDGSFGFGTGPGPGVIFNAIAFQPGTNVGLAVGNSNNLWRTTDGGVSWTKLAAQTTANQACAEPGANGPDTLGSLYAIAWGASNVVYVGGDKRTVLRSQDAGASWTEVNKTTNGCQIGGSGFGPSSTDISDIQVIDSSSGRANEVVYFQGREAFGPFYVSVDGLQSEATFQAGGPNGTQNNTHFVADPANPNRVWSTNGCGFSCFVHSEDAMVSAECVCSPLNADTSGNQTDHYDIDFAGGTTLAVGDTGEIEQSTNGSDFYFNRALAPNNTTNWRAVSLADATHAAVGGIGGALVVTDQAATVPDILNPAGTVTGPVTAVAGQPATYTANVADNAGGTGIDPASFAWTTTGLPNASGNPVALTFPSAGYYTVTVSFKDRAGNAGSASLSVIVDKPTTAPTIPPIPIKPKSPAGTKTVAVAGGTVTLKGPAKCVPAGSSFTVTLSFKRSKKKGATFVKVTRTDFYIDGKRKKIDKKAPFSQKLTVKKLKTGSKHSLKARAYIKVKKGKSPKKSITTSFTVCG
jgi:hypothetical protein